MKSRILTSLMTVTLLGTLIFSADVRAQYTHHKIISFDVPGAVAGFGTFAGTGCFGCTFAINQWGTIVGTYVDGVALLYHGFVRSPNGTITTFDDPSADTSTFFHGTVAQGINDLGEITGHYTDSAGINHGFVRSPTGAFTSFDAPDGENGTTPLFISLEGAVVGFAMDTNGLFHGFLRRAGGNITDFVGPNSCTSNGMAGCFGTEASHVDFFGFAVGNFEDNTANMVSHGLIRTPGGTLTTFDAPGAGTGPIFQGTGCPGCNMGFNFLGAIAGTFVDTKHVIHGFLRSPGGKFTTFDAPGAGSGPDFFQGTGCFSDCPVSMNDFGAITGSYMDSTNTQHGYLRNPNGTFVTIDPPGSVATQPESINDSGTIAGYYTDSATSTVHGFLMLNW